MTLVPLGDRIVLKTAGSRRDYKVRYRSSGPGTGETAAGGSYRGRPRRNG